MSTTARTFPRPASRLRIRRARLRDLPQLSPLFDAYRVFYGQPGDPRRARHFLRERLRRRQSLILVAKVSPGELAGFTQLYPAFSSVSAAPLYLLNDLFVTPAHRGAGVARALLAAATQVARQRGAIRLNLETHRDNVVAQRLYASAGWQRDEDHYFYEYDLRSR